MSRKALIMCGIALAAISAAPATAGLLTFTGSSMSVNAPPSPDPSCAPLLKLNVGPANTSGTSNFGAFTFQQTHCSTGAPGPYGPGTFSFFFEQGDMFSGTYTGVFAPSGTPGLSNNNINYLVTAGTGRFLGGTGSITGIGTVDFRQGAPRQQFALNGLLNLPAVPEPATWASMIAGFGLIGGAMRRRRLVVRPV